MTGEDMSDWPLRQTTRLLAPAFAARIAAWLLRARLDRALGDGANPASSPLIAARAMQLSRGSTRARTARGLERLALSANEPPSRVRIRPSRTAILANRPELLELASILRHDRPVYARGVAIVEVTLTDGTGPAYTDRRGEALARQLQLARAALTA